MIKTSHTHHGLKIAELTADEHIIKTSEDGLHLLGDLYYQGYDHIIIHEKNITPDFFDLRNGMAGEILQKFSTYRVRLAIVGDFAKYPGKSIAAFIYESNRGKIVNFADSVNEALERLSN
jgi:hypothetical protein